MEHETFQGMRQKLEAGIGSTVESYMRLMYLADNRGEVRRAIIEDGEGPTLENENERILQDLADRITSDDLDGVWALHKKAAFDLAQSTGNRALIDKGLQGPLELVNGLLRGISEFERRHRGGASVLPRFSEKDFARESVIKELKTFSESETVEGRFLRLFLGQLSKLKERRILPLKFELEGYLTEGKNNATVHESVPSGEKKQPKTPLPVVALKFIYEGKVIEKARKGDPNCETTRVAKSYGHNSGETLYRHYCFYSKAQNLRAAEAEISLEKRVEYISQVLPLLEKGKENAESDLIHLQELAKKT